MVILQVPGGGAQSYTCSSIKRWGSILHRGSIKGWGSILHRGSIKGWGSILHMRFNQGVGLNLFAMHYLQNSDISQSHDMVCKHTCIHQLFEILFLRLRSFFPYHSCNREAISNSRQKNPQEIFPTKKITIALALHCSQAFPCLQFRIVSSKTGVGEGLGTRHSSSRYQIHVGFSILRVRNSSIHAGYITVSFPGSCIGYGVWVLENVIMSNILIRASNP